MDEGKNYTGVSFDIDNCDFSLVIWRNSCFYLLHKDNVFHKHDPEGKYIGVDEEFTKKYFEDELRLEVEERFVWRKAVLGKVIEWLEEFTWKLKNWEGKL